MNICKCKKGCLCSLQTETKQPLETRINPYKKGINTMTNSLNQIPQKAIVTFDVITPEERLTYSVSGREGQALYCLYKAKNKGITSLEVLSSCRLASYIFNLRHNLNLDILTVREANKTGFGHYGRFILQSNVEIKEIKHGNQQLKI